jgi:hypothetical protein
MAFQFNENPLLVFGLFVVIGGMFVLALKMLSTGSGWAELAGRYPGRTSVGGDLFEGVSLNSSRRGSYGRQVVVVVDRHALHLFMHLPSRLFHRPISVPWERIGGFSSHPWQSGMLGISFSEMDLVFYVDERVISAARTRWESRVGEPVT